MRQIDSKTKLVNLAELQIKLLERESKFEIKFTISHVKREK